VLIDQYRDLLGPAVLGKQANLFAPKHAAIPVARSAFPDEICAPRNGAEKAYPNLDYFNRVPRGGHFAAWGQPRTAVCATREVRAGVPSYLTRDGRQPVDGAMLSDEESGSAEVAPARSSAENSAVRRTVGS
jgi:hypothetical protein